MFQETMFDALAHKFDVLVVHKLDRFARNVRVTLEYLERLEKAGVGFVSISEQMDFSTPIGKVILANLAAFGQYYSDNLSTEVRKGLRERAMQGLWIGPVPFGYKPVDGKLVVVDGEAELLRRIFEMCASGVHTCETIATWLNQSEFRPRHGKRRKDREYLWTGDRGLGERHPTKRILPWLREAQGTVAAWATPGNRHARTV
ncbi:MAG: recombinase family protein [Dehalococcoidia bacterium]|nr:recombinase family protein [Dehalococcoidia bacterium]MDP7085775.1 recombinase family protein [Dehalococcoidia bacterium]